MARYNYDKYKSQSSDEPQSAGSSTGRYDYSKYRQDSGSLTPDQQRISNQEQSDFAQMDQAAQTGALIQADEYRQRADAQQLDEQAQMDAAQQTYADMPKVQEYRTAAHGLPVIGPVLRGLDAFSENPTVDKVAGFARSLYTPGASLGNIGAMTGVVGRGLGRIAPNLGSTFGGRLAQEAIKEGAVGVPLGAGQSLASGNPDLMDAGKSGLIGGALGGVGGAAFPLIGRGIQAAESAAARGLGQAEARPSLGAAVNDFMRNVDNAGPDVPGRNVLSYDASTFSQPGNELADRYRFINRDAMNDTQALPDPIAQRRYQEAVNRRGAPQSSGDVIAPYGETPTFALPEGNYVQPQRLRVEANPDPYINRVMEQIKPIVNERMTPPLENPNELAKWVQQHGFSDASLNEVRRLPYEDLRTLANEIKSGLNVRDEAVKAARELGYDLPALLERQTPSVGQRVTGDAQARTAGVYPESLPNVRQPEGFNTSVSGQAAAPVTVAGRLKGTVRQAPAKTLSPLPKEAAVPQERLRAARPITEAPKATGEMQPAPRQPVDLRQSEKPGMRERGFVSTLKASDKPEQGLKERLKSMYTPITNEEAVSRANLRIDKDIESAVSYVSNARVLTAEHITTGHRLIDEFQKQGNYSRAVEIAEKMAEAGTRAGQSIQAFSIYNRLTPQGILVHAKRIVERVNQKIHAGIKPVEVTEQTAAQITDLATTMQKMTGIKDLSNDVTGILEKAKTGEKLTDTESAALRRFVDESKQFVKETERKPRPPKPPQEIKNKRVRDNVISFLDAQERAAKERLRARGIQVSSTPLDVWADYAVIGAAKLAKGTIKFADWSEQMVKDLGEDIRPHLENLYDRAKQAYEQSSKVVTKQTISDAERIAERVIKANLEGKKITPEQADSMQSLAQKVSKLSGEEKRIASQDLQAVMQTLERPGMLKKVSSTQTIGQLLNPKTQVRNALGNELFYRVERLNKLLSTPIDIVRSKITGGERTVTFRTNNQGEYWSNWMRGLKAGWKGVNVNGLETQYDLGSPAFRGKYNPLTYMEKSLGAALKSFDTAAYMRAYNNTIGELSTLRAVNEGRRGSKELIQKYIREADDNMMSIADEYGRYVTLQDNNVISNGLVAAKRGLNSITGSKDFGLGDIILKYPKTPGNILMRALEYSPAGFVRSGMILARPWFKKEPNTAEVTQALSRAIVGTFGFTGLGYFLMDKGVLTGSASKDRDVRDLQRSAGQGQYQVNLSALTRFVTGGFDTAAVKLQEGDLLYTYDWMQPVSIAASIGANVKKNLSEGKGTLSGLAGTAYNSLEGGLSTLTEQSVLSGLKRAAEGYPGQTVTDKITDILSDIPASFVPTASNQINQLMDNNRRETYSPSKVDQSLNKAQAKIPGLAQDLPRQFDTLGRPKEAYQENNAFNVLLNPGFASRYELSPEAKMVVDLIKETGDETLAPRVPGKSITIEDPNDKKKNIQLKLNGDQFSRYQQLQGEKTREDIIKKYRPEASQKSRVDKVRGILTESGDEAKRDLKKEIGVR